MKLKEVYKEYLRELSDNKFQKTKRKNEEGREVLTNHRGISGITPQQKSFCYTPVAKTFEKAYFTDIDDNQYVDIAMGFGVHLFGHRPSWIQEELQKQQESWGLGPMTPQMFEVAEGIQSLTGVERLSFFNTGTEAVMVAMRLARAYTKKNKVVMFKSAYHGHHEASLVFKTDPMSGVPMALIPGITDNAQADTILLEFDDEASIIYIQEHAAEIAAVLTEPVQSRNPGCQPQAFLKQLRKVTEECKIALIFDEVITGFRIHPGGAQAYFGIEADIVTYGKVIGGGMPIGIVAGKSVYLDMIDGGQWKYDDQSLPEKRKTFIAGTFCHHPMSIAASYAVVQKLQIEGEELIEALNNKTTAFAKRVNRWMSQHQIPIHVHQFCSLFKFDVPSIAKVWYHHLMIEGIYVWEGKTCFLSTAHTDEDISFIEKTIYKTALLMKSCGCFTTKKHELSADELDVSLASACQFDLTLNIACNIGACLKIEENLNDERLSIAINHVYLHLPFVTGSVMLQNQTSPKTVLDIEKWKESFMQQDILHLGCIVEVVKTNQGHTYMAIAGHKTRMDGWSLSLVISHILSVYEALSTANGLPDITFQTGKLKTANSHATNLQVSDASKTSFSIDHTYVDLKRKARGINKNSQPIDMVKAIFVLAIQRYIKDEIITVGTPVAGQLKASAFEHIGPYSHVEVSQYLGFCIEDLPTCMATERKVTELMPRYVVNIDRWMNTYSPFTMEPIPLDAPYIRYDIVLNLMIHEDSIGVDIKWRKEKYAPEKIEEMVQYIKQQLTSEYAYLQG